MGWDPFFVRNLIFGIQDSVVSTTGVLVGIAWGGLRNRDILLTGAVLVLAEALSMTLGSFVSEDAFVKSNNQTIAPTAIAKYALTMFVAYAGTGLALLIPFALDLAGAWVYSAAAGVLALGVLGTAIRGAWYGMAVACVGALITAVSAVVGVAFKV